MHYKIRVVETRGPDNTVFFFCDNVTFDLFFSQVLSWEDEQFMTVSAKEGGAEETIRLFDPYGPVPDRKFDYKGSITDYLYAFQFNPGDIISFNVRDTGGIGGDMASRITNSYIRHYVATHIHLPRLVAPNQYEQYKYDDLSPQKKYAFTEELRSDARERIKKNDGRLLFRQSEREEKQVKELE